MQKFFSILMFTLLNLSTTFAGQVVPLSDSTRLSDLQGGEKIIISSTLKVKPGGYGNVADKETLTGLGRWCTMSISNTKGEIKALLPGQAFSVKGPVKTFSEGLSRYVTIETEEGLEIECLGGFLVQKMKTKNLEDKFDNVFQFVEP